MCGRLAEVARKSNWSAMISALPTGRLSTASSSRTHSSGGCSRSRMCCRSNRAATASSSSSSVAPTRVLRIARAYASVCSSPGTTAKLEVPQAAGVGLVVGPGLEPARVRALAQVVLEDLAERGQGAVAVQFRDALTRLGQGLRGCPGAVFHLANLRAGQVDTGAQFLRGQAGGRPVVPEHGAEDAERALGGGGLSLHSLTLSGPGGTRPAPALDSRWTVCHSRWTPGDFSFRT